MVSGSLSQAEGSERSSRSAPLSTYTEKFYELFPYYLSIGMTPNQYWNDDCTLVIYYRKSAELGRERINQEMWLQGMYIYEALCCASPIFHDFAKKGTKAHPYPSAPYSLTRQQREKDKQEKAAKVAAKGKRYLEALMQTTAQNLVGMTLNNFSEREVSHDVDND